MHTYSTGFKYIEKINATVPQPQRNVLKYFAIFKNVAHSFEPGETPSYSASHQAQKLFTTFLNLAKNDEIMSNIQFTGTATQSQRNRNATAILVNLIMTSTVPLTATNQSFLLLFYVSIVSISFVM